MNFGTVYWVNLEPTTPPEFGKIRPCLVISNTEQNFILPTVVVLPLSSRPPEIRQLRIKVELKTKKLGTSYVVIPGIRQISKLRLLDKVSALSPTAMETILHSLALYLHD